VRYKVKRVDSETDDIKTQLFQRYDMAYNLLANIHGNLCYSNAGYNDRPYYKIIKINTLLNH